MFLGLNHDYRIHEIKSIKMTQLLSTQYSALFIRLHKAHNLYKLTWTIRSVPSFQVFMPASQGKRAFNLVPWCPPLKDRH